jgi:hypothetical protein
MRYLVAVFHGIWVAKKKLPYLIQVFHELCFATKKLPWYLVALKWVLLGIMLLIQSIYYVIDLIKPFDRTGKKITGRQDQSRG